jgi:hypothetical protein
MKIAKNKSMKDKTSNDVDRINNNNENLVKEIWELKN